jgi:hypothetical protein
MKKPIPFAGIPFTGYAAIDLFGHPPTDQFFNELVKQYGFESARSIFLMAIDRANRLQPPQPRRTKPTGPHKPVENLELVTTWTLWDRQNPGEGKYAWEKWLIETFGFSKRERGTYVRRLNEALKYWSPRLVRGQ